MNRSIHLSVFFVCLMLIGQMAAAEWDGINYQGRLLEAGAPYSGTTNFSFSIYTQLVGGVVSYTEKETPPLWMACTPL